MSDSTSSRHPIPFYSSYAAFLRTMAAFKENGIPRRVTPRSLTPLLGEEATRISTGLAATGWVDDNGIPTQDLTTLVDSFGTPAWKSALLSVLKLTYSFIPEDWADLTADRLHEAFVLYVGRDANVMKSAETFFLSLALAGGVNLPDKLFLRANRAHFEANRPKEDDVQTEAASVVQLALEQTGQESKEPRDRKNSQRESQVLQKTWNDWVSRILDLTGLISEPDITNKEREAVLTLVSYFHRRNTSDNKGQRA